MRTINFCNVLDEKNVLRVKFDADMENLPDDFRLVLLPDDDAELREYNIKLLTQYIYDDVLVVFVRMHLSSGEHLHYYQNYNVYAPLATA